VVGAPLKQSLPAIKVQHFQPYQLANLNHEEN
jgi:hypothetical protein